MCGQSASLRVYTPEVGVRPPNKAQAAKNLIGTMFATTRSNLGHQKELVGFGYGWCV